MARQIDSEITGTIDNIIFYERDGEFLMRAVPVQSTGTKQAAKAFGRAASLAKILRQLLTSIIPDPKDKNMQNRLVTAMAKFLGGRSDTNPELQEANALAGFRFVPTSSLEDCLKFKLAITRPGNGKIQVEIPAIDPLLSIYAPAGTTRVELKMMAVALNPENRESFAGIPQVLEIPYTSGMRAAESVVLETGLIAGSMVVVVVALGYWDGERRIYEEGFMPAEIVLNYD